MMLVSLAMLVSLLVPSSPPDMRKPRRKDIRGIEVCVGTRNRNQSRALWLVPGFLSLESHGRPHVHDSDCGLATQMANRTKARNTIWRILSAVQDADVMNHKRFSLKTAALDPRHHNDTWSLDGSKIDNSTLSASKEHSKDTKVCEEIHRHLILRRTHKK